jgi:lauroyl/myristoyl acyltransferase
VVSARLMFRTYSTLGRALAAVPEPVALGIAGIVGDVLHQVRHEPRRNVERNLRRVVGRDVDQASLNRWSRRAFRAYARYWVEGARLPRTSRSEVRQRFVVVDGFEHLVEAMAAGNGVVLALPHVGSWEYGGTYLAAVGYPMTSVAERLEPPELFEYFVNQRAAMGLTIVPLDSTSGGAVMRTLREGGLVGLLCDRDLLDNGIDVTFFGEKTTMPAGPATLAMRTGAALLTAAVYSGPGQDHHAVVGGPIDLTRTGPLRSDVSRVTQEIADRFESLIRRAPEQWHVFQPLWSADRSEVGP